MKTVYIGPGSLRCPDPEVSGALVGMEVIVTLLMMAVIASCFVYLMAQK